MKSPIIILVVIALAISFGATFKYNQEAQSATGQLNNERYSRMLAEENFEKAKASVDSLESELARVRNKLNVFEKSLEQTKVINEDLKQRLDKAAEFKDNLEVKIKELQRISGVSMPSI